MADHRISVCSIGMIGGFTVQCSCDPGRSLLVENLISLAELNDLAHEHIEAADTAPRVYDRLRDLVTNWPGKTGRVDELHVEGYRPEP